MVKPSFSLSEAVTDQIEYQAAMLAAKLTKPLAPQPIKMWRTTAVRLQELRRTALLKTTTTLA